MMTLCGTMLFIPKRKKGLQVGLGRKCKEGDDEFKERTQTKLSAMRPCTKPISGTDQGRVQREREKKGSQGFNDGGGMRRVLSGRWLAYNERPTRPQAMVS